MARKLLRNGAGKLLFEDPGDLLYLANGNGGGSFQCPECTAGCQTNYYTTINLTSGTCNGNCTDIAGQTITQVGSTCQWTATQGNWTHEMVCIGAGDGKWRYKVWDGGIGNTLCASWVQVAEQQLACPPLGSDLEGVWVRDGGACFGDGLRVGTTCPTNFSECEACGSFSVTISGFSSPCAGLNRSGATVSHNGDCTWSGSDININCGSPQDGFWFLVVFDVFQGKSAYFLKENVDGCLPTGSWTQYDEVGCSGQTGTCTVS